MWTIIGIILVLLGLLGLVGLLPIGLLLSIALIVIGAVMVLYGNRGRFVV